MMLIKRLHHLISWQIFAHSFYTQLIVAFDFWGGTPGG